MIEPTAITPVTSIVSVQVGQPQTRTDDSGKKWTSAIGKSAAPGPAMLRRENLEGDRQSNRKYHGGPDKAVCVYASEHYPLWRQEFDKPEQPFGSFGENLTTSGLTEEGVCIGDVYRAPSGAMIQVCQPRVPCANVRRFWGAARLPVRMEETGFTGFYCRVIAEGELSSEDVLTRIERPCPDWTIARVNRAFYSKATDAVKAERRAIIAIEPPLSSECVAHLRKLGV
ncbi:MAG: MOSC domain-containing protein [Akkermansiaceae bacterium]|nr:MOSC domain-containing protein [Armatimonadota bacterium]